MNKELFDRLIKAGVPEAEAEAIAKSHRPVDPESVDVDALTKAMQDIRTTFEGDPEVDPEADPEVDPEADPEEDIVKAIAGGADRILEQGRSHIEARAQAQVDILARLDVLSKGFLALAEAVQADKTIIAKGLKDVQEELGVPQPPKAVVGGPIPAPADSAAAGDLVPQDVVRKALNLMEKSDDPGRQGELQRAVARLESGVNPHEVVREFNIDLSVV